MTTDIVAKPQSQPNIFEEYRNQAVAFFKSGLCPAHIKSPEQAMIIAAKGREVGMPFFASMDSFFVIGNSAQPKTKAKLALAMASGELQDFEILYAANEVTARVKRSTRPSWIVTKYGVKEATSMQLINKDNYQKQSMHMFQERALGHALDLGFADILHGLPSGIVEPAFDEDLRSEPLQFEPAAPDTSIGQTPVEETPTNTIGETPIKSEPQTNLPPAPEKPDMAMMLNEIKDKLAQMNSGDWQEMNYHLERLTKYKSKKTGKWEAVKLGDLEGISIGRPAWIESIYIKVLAEYGNYKQNAG